LIADLLAPLDDEVRRAFAEAEAVLDMSASVTVARHLVHGIDSPARRGSLFLNPDGTDLVLLVEDAERRVRLDDLEMQYYREIANNPDLSHHLLRNGERIRYAHGCRDVTATIGQDQVAAYSGIGARAVRLALDAPAATLAIWRAGEDFAVSVIRSEPVTFDRLRLGDWTLALNPTLLRQVQELRAGKLPNETGGVLLGSFDLQRKIVYVVDTIPSPPDSQEWPELYIRGHKGLREQVERVDRVTGGGLQYVGEWHSHPDGAACNPSEDDSKVFDWLQSYMALDGLPPLMVIIGEAGRSSWSFTPP
jgi:proteasome lid subunit RPN8/RPN11